VGLIIVEATFIRPDGRGFTHQLGIHTDAMIPGLSRLTEKVHAAGAKIAIQLHHAGRETTASLAGTQPVGPSPIACPVMREIPHEMSREEITVLEDDFALAAARAQRAGFDAVELHGAHGYVIAAFLSPFSNHRTDEYGGGLQSRARLAVETIRKVRGAVGEKYPILFRISADEWLDGGLTLAQTKAMAPMLVEAGVDAIHVSVGNYATPGGPNIAPMEADVALLVPLAQGIRDVVSVPVIAVGRIHDPFVAEQVIGERRADMIAMGRALLADPDLPAKALRGAFNEILPCIACNQGCIEMLEADKSITCLINPACGRDDEFAIDRAGASKRVLVIGGGPGGLEAARVAALRGHDVTLLEKSDRLGGRFLAAGMSPTKQAILPAIAWSIRQLGEVGVKVELGVEAMPDQVAERRPDVVIVATGARPVGPPVPGLNTDTVVFAEDVLMGRVDTNHRVLVVGGGGTGLDVAGYLALQGKDVTIVEMLDSVGTDLGPAHRYWVLGSLGRMGVKVLTGTRLTAIDGEHVEIETQGTRTRLAVDCPVVLCSGYVGTGKEWDSLKSRVPELHFVGDAVTPRKALDAIHEAAVLSRRI
jgi:2,4-dienoyl-CoA reductase-like NADH-dependent reductase (Old Yellow Enzyme family)/NADPH-dependent 2,4-dienoyl-CoA reductase/sulfur reductase-like enzyme